jgi:predicted dithiol-disulfide oxidoreductase (DUF899 family)
VHQIVPHEQWLEARKAFLAQEKAFTRERDRLSQARRDLPWERVDKDYVFDGPAGKQTLAQLFGSSSQLVVYHFMYDPEWDEGCKSCSFWADNFNGIPVHLRARDTAFVAVSRAPLFKLEAYRKRMGWSFPWLSSSDTDFNRDFGVEFTEEEVERKGAAYNYTVQDPFDTQREGVSVFYKDESGAVYHTYSAYARGIDLLNGAYNYIDLTPKGRDEGEGNMAWLRRHDEY